MSPNHYSEGGAIASRPIAPLEPVTVALDHSISKLEQLNERLHRLAAQIASRPGLEKRDPTTGQIQPLYDLREKANKISRDLDTAIQTFDDISATLGY